MSKHVDNSGNELLWESSLAHRQAAWWSAVMEPADTDVVALRHALGDEEAVAWVCAEQPSSLPLNLFSEARASREYWERAHQRWHPRALVADPGQDFGVLEGLGGRFLIPSDPQWPQALADLGPSQPVGLWVLGTIPNTRSCSIVGARASTQYGNIMAHQIASDLAHKSITVVSGGAFGIDIAAHRGAMDGVGRTVAVMAGGLAELYPRSHDNDFKRIIHTGGAIISESPPTWRPARWRFLSRNRLVAALSSATVVIEAGLRSGALSTARQAMSLGREVGALPGMTTHELSKGCHELIRNGATLIRHAGDITEMLSPYTITEQTTLFGDPVQIDCGIDALPPTLRRVWETLSERRPIKLDALTRESGMAQRDVLAALAGLELSGRITSSAGGWKRVAS